MNSDEIRKSLLAAAGSLTAAATGAATAEGVTVAQITSIHKAKEELKKALEAFPATKPATK